MPDARLLSEEAALKDLELQWNDHFHMRDQSWKTLQNCSLAFVGIVGLDVADKVDNWLVAVTYVVVCVLSYFGMEIVDHHRIRQRQKFAVIKALEERLGIWQAKAAILVDPPRRYRDTSSFIWYALASIFTVCLMLACYYGLSELTALISAFRSNVR